MSAGTISSTLFYDLTSPKPGTTRMDYPATDLIYKLLHHTGADVASFRRNCQVSYRLVEYARDLYDGINQGIQKAEDSGEWEHYDEYNRAIDPLEEVLLDIMAVTEVERDEYLLHATSPELVEQSIESWINLSISGWLENRKRIRECLDGFRTQEVFSGFIASPTDYEIEIQSAKAHDDRTLLQNLLKSIENRGKPQNVQMVKKVKESLQSALDFLKGSPKKSLEDDLSVLAIKCAMVTYGVTELMKDDKIKQHPQLCHRLYGSKIWGAAQRLATNIHDHLKRNDEAPNLSQLNAIYEELEASLTGEVPILMPDAYRKLFPLVGKIGRAYHAQSLVLASLCHKVASHFEKNKNFEAREALEKALDKTIEAFTAAGGLNKLTANGTDHTVNGAPVNGAGPNITGEYDMSFEKLYDESVDQIKSCYSTMQMNDEPDPQEKLKEARNKDQKRLELYRTRVTNVTPVREFVDLTLLVFNDDSNASPVNKLHVKVLPTARLSYIRWITAKELKDRDLETSHFEKPTQKQPMSLDAEIKPLVNDNKCTLHLILQKGEPTVNGSN
ncbi:unnamed protein product [Rhizoctonia solani]|uniref:Uncharacterized protein n=1 Tax=Rhizoctonia solani TaxID=456999 RepID=A0A8H2XAQ7_9AGAM|nr:unnamed protein product [Rhizoctonia solani]